MSRTPAQIDYYWRLDLRRRIEYLNRVHHHAHPLDALYHVAVRMGMIIAVGAPQDAIVDYLTQAGRILAQHTEPLTDDQLGLTIAAGITLGRKYPAWTT